MQTLLLATGNKRKLRPLTASVPSPMVPISNRPVMLYPLEMLARQDVERFVICLGENAGHIEAYFGSGQRWGVSLQYVLRRDELGTAGTLKQAAAYLDDTFLVMPGDAMIDLDLPALLAAHQQRGSWLTAVVHSTASGQPTSLAVGQDDEILGVDALTPETAVYATGAYLINKQVLDLIPRHQSMDIATDLIPLLKQQNKPIHGFTVDGYWNALDTLKMYEGAQAHFLETSTGTDIEQYPEPVLRPHWQSAHQRAPGVWVGRNTVIHPQAGVSAPVMIGDNCYVGRDVRLGPNTVIGANVVIDDEATVSNSVILPQTYIGQLVRLNGRIVRTNLVIDIETEESSRMTDDFLLGQTFSTVAETGLQTTLEKLMALLLIFLSLWVTIPIALATLVSNGRLFERVDRYHARLDHTTGKMNRRKLVLYRFITRNKQGDLTRLGQLLHRYDWYRLPELWGVVTGKISFVGVKPLTEIELNKVTESWQMTRYQVNPGFTGAWYVQTNRPQETDELLIADAYYVATHSWRQDLQLVAKTPVAWWRRATGPIEFPQRTEFVQPATD